MSYKKALLIIDMQKGSFTPETPRYDTPQVVERINQLTQIFRATGNFVIYIQHDGSKTNEFIPATTEWELLDELEVKPSDIIVSKIANDAFYQTDLQHFLSESRVQELWITGCATDFCVESTIQSALVKDYQITVVADGHTTADRPNLKAEQVIAHYNWVWQDMMPTQGKISVKNFAKLKQELEIGTS